MELPPDTQAPAAFVQGEAAARPQSSAAIRFIRIFLLVLIIIGIGLLCTIHFWVPKLVERLVPSYVPAVIDVSTTQIKEYKTYKNSEPPFSVQYPHDYSVDSNYTYGELEESKNVKGVKFTMPASITIGTNLASDSYFSIEWVPSEQNPRCLPSFFLPGSPKDIVVNSTDGLYVVASTTGAAAGNRYEETVYSYAGVDMPFCVVERHFIHYGAIENYPAGTTKEFDRAALMTQFGSITQSLRYLYQGQI